MEVCGKMRGGWLATVLALVSTAAGIAQAPGAVEPPGWVKTMLLWPEGAPGAKGSAETDRPELTAVLPTTGATGTGIVIAPGGAYQNLAMGHEGFQEAQWLASHGIAAFVLRYRLGPTYGYPIEQNDAKRAIRLVRARAAEFGVRPDRIGMMGFSAGGHLAATTGTIVDQGNAGAADPIDRQSSRPDFLVLGYPVISMEDGVTHSGSQRNLLGDHPTEEQKRLLSADQRVTAQTPPTFLFSTTDDKVVPIQNSLLFYAALVKAGVPVEMHLFQHGDHGFGMAPENPELHVWPELMLTWLRAQGLAVPAK